VLLEEIECLEIKNLQLIERCDEINHEIDGMVMRLGGEVTKTDREREQIMTQTATMPVVELVNPRTNQITKETEAIDCDVTTLSKMIELHYRECFKKSVDITALTMLKRLEIEIEKIYAVTLKISQQFLAEKQSRINKARREEQRRKKQETQELEQ
jgi:hypothetical protein